MPRLVTSPAHIPVPGGKLIEEHVGRVSTGTYGNPFETEAAYWAVCAPAFSPETVRREE